MSPRMFNHTPRMQAPITSSGGAPFTPLGCRPQSHPMEMRLNRTNHTPWGQAPITATDTGVNHTRSRLCPAPRLHTWGQSKAQLRTEQSQRRRPQSLGPGYAQGADLNPWGRAMPKAQACGRATPQSQTTTIPPGDGAMPKAQASITPQRMGLSPRHRPQSHPRKRG